MWQFVQALVLVFRGWLNFRLIVQSGGCISCVPPPPQPLFLFFSLFSSISSIPLKLVVWITLLLRVVCAQVGVGMRCRGCIALPRHIIPVYSDRNFSVSERTTNFQASWTRDESCVRNRLAHDIQTTALQLWAIIRVHLKPDHYNALRNLWKYIKNS
jgi:hypothetical protein